MQCRNGLSFSFIINSTLSYLLTQRYVLFDTPAAAFFPLTFTLTAIGTVIDQFITYFHQFIILFRFLGQLFHYRMPWNFLLFQLCCQLFHIICMGFVKRFQLCVCTTIKNIKQNEKVSLKTRSWFGWSLATAVDKIGYSYPSSCERAWFFNLS